MSQIQEEFKALIREEMRGLEKRAQAVAIEKYEEKMQIERQNANDNRLYNTEQLLRNYRNVKKHCESAITSAKEIPDNDLIDYVELMTGMADAEFIRAQSIRKSVMWAKVVIEHIDTMLMGYQQQAYKSGKEIDIRRCDTIFKRFINETPMTTKDIAMEAPYYINDEQLDSSIRMVNRDIEQACQEISVLFFGLASIIKE